MRILFLGDICGRPGRTIVTQQVPLLRQRWKLDAVIANGENAAAGFGITEAILHEFLECGIDAVTLGNHSWDQREALVFIDRQPRLVRPANYPAGTPGRGATLIETASGARVLVVNLLGRLFMEAFDDSVRAVERELEACPLGQVADAIVVDMHCEATSEKQVMGHMLDGRVSLVVGTHTHTPSADARILSGGTAFQTDTGMCGDYAGVIGFDRREPVRRYIERTPGGRWESASGPGTLCGIAIETDDRTGLAVSAARVCIGPELENCGPAW
ncbi:MAG TPA: TIGR00282 family metallophosphoesterase [Beijerinckiaceae bacterium]|nr:TIGR00282 family metallophosphoesterase [Beijerinckiaceae bacterium]